MLGEGPAALLSPSWKLLLAYFAKLGIRLERMMMDDAARFFRQTDSIGFCAESSA
jgi:hypothetical protein